MYSPEEREIYCCLVGGRPRRYDPLVIRRRLVLESDGRFEAIRAEYESDDELLSLRAEDLLVRLARSAFDFRPITDTESPDEVTDADALETLYDWIEWMGKPSSAGDSPPNSSQPSESCRS